MAETGYLRIPGLVLVLFAFTFIASPAHAHYGGGTGEPNDPYLIYTAEQMNAIGAEPNDWGKHFRLMADIDLAELGDKPFNIIGTNLSTSSRSGPDGTVSTSVELTPPFTGVFDGNGHTLSNFVCTSTKASYVGLFGVVADPNAEIRNLTLAAPRIDCWTGHMGALVGFLRQGTLTNCHAENVEVGGNAQNIGGLLGLCGFVSSDTPAATPGTVRDCSCTGRVSGGYFAAGGLVGKSEYGFFYGCFAACDVSGGDYVGGLGGDATRTWFVDCYSTGSVMGGRLAGGLFGISGGVDVINCYSAHRISAMQQAGGFSGAEAGTRFTACFWDAEISGLPDTADPNGKTTAEMQDPNLFLAAGWDFVGKPDTPSDIWAEPAGGGYPVLSWQLPEPPASPFAGGTGTPEDPYQIATAEQLNSIAYTPRLMWAHFRLVNDIDLSGVHVYLIGNAQYPYAGRFDGGGFTISNFTYSTSELENVGLFRVIGGSAEIRDLTLAAPEIDAPNARTVGSLVALARGGILRNCHVAGGHVSGLATVGGMVGQNGVSVAAQLLGCDSTADVTGDTIVGGLTGHNGRHAFLDNCWADANVAGKDLVGGLAAINDSGTIRNCRSAGQVLGQRWVGGLIGRSHDTFVTRSLSKVTVSGSMYVGGLVGMNSSTVTDCHSMGDVTGDTDVGGLVGCNEFLNPHDLLLPGAISRCYAIGRVTGKTSFGGLVGYQVLGSTTASFWDVQTTGVASRSSEFAKTTAQMQTAGTFLAAGWDFAGETENGTEDIWWILEGQDYPRLSWELGEE
jgi:fibronectin-binding autotransporter adhesin